MGRIQALTLIRGTSTRARLPVAGTQSPVAVYIDDLNILDPFSPKITPSLRLFDTNRVEVLEGPQGTLFGSGSIGGAIRIISNKPNLTEFEAETEDAVENTSGGAASYETNIMVNIPIVSDELALRVVGYYDRDGGYIDNIARDESNVNRSISEGGRVELEFVPTSHLTLIASAMFANGRPHDSAYSFYNNKQYQWNGLVPNTNSDNTDIYRSDWNLRFWLVGIHVHHDICRSQRIWSHGLQRRRSCVIGYQRALSRGRLRADEDILAGSSPRISRGTTPHLVDWRRLYRRTSDQH